MVHDFKRQINYTEFTIITHGKDIAVFCVEGYEEVLISEPGDPFNVTKTFYSIKITSKTPESTASRRVIYHTTEEESVLNLFTAQILETYDGDMRRVNTAIKYSLPWNHTTTHQPCVMVFKGQNINYMQQFINHVEKSRNPVRELKRDLTYNLRIPCLDPQYNPENIVMQMKIKTDYSVEVKLMGPAPAVQLDLPYSFPYFYHEILRLMNFIRTESSNHRSRPSA